MWGAWDVWAVTRMCLLVCGGMLLLFVVVRGLCGAWDVWAPLRGDSDMWCVCGCLGCVVGYSDMCLLVVRSMLLLVVGGVAGGRLGGHGGPAQAAGAEKPPPAPQYAHTIHFTSESLYIRLARRRLNRRPCAPTETRMGAVK